MRTVVGVNPYEDFIAARLAAGETVWRIERGFELALWRHQKRAYLHEVYAYCRQCRWLWWMQQYHRYEVRGREPVCFAYPMTGLSGEGCRWWETANPVGMTAQTWLEEGL